MKISKIFDKSFIRFLLVGVSNTLLSAILMFVLEDLGYWASTAIAYIAGAILSFFLNRNFTFKSEEKTGKSAVKFAVNVLLCYVIAYSLAQPFVEWIMSYTPINGVWMDRITKLFGMAFYTLINYFGQRFFAFKKPTHTVTIKDDKGHSATYTLRDCIIEVNAVEKYLDLKLDTGTQTITYKISSDRREPYIDYIKQFLEETSKQSFEIFDEHVRSYIYVEGVVGRKQFTGYKEEH